MPTESEYLELLHRVEQLERKVVALQKAAPSYREHMPAVTIEEKAEALVERLGGACTPWRLDRTGGFKTWRAHVTLPGSEKAVPLGVQIPTGTSAAGLAAWTLVADTIDRVFRTKGADE